MIDDAFDDDPMVSWRQRKTNLKIASTIRQSARNQSEVKKTNAWRRLKREATEAAQNPDNLHDGFSR